MLEMNIRVVADFDARPHFLFRKPLAAACLIDHLFPIVVNDRARRLFHDEPSAWLELGDGAVPHLRSCGGGCRGSFSIGGHGSGGQERADNWNQYLFHLFSFVVGFAGSLFRNWFHQNRRLGFDRAYKYGQKLY